MDWFVTLQKWLLVSTVLNLWNWCRSEIQNGRYDELSLTLDPMGISHFHLLFWNHWTDFNQTWQKCYAGGPLPDLWNWCRSKIQHGRQGQLCVLIGPNFKNLLVRNYNVDWTDTLQKWFLGGPVLSLWIICRSEIQNGRRDETKFNIGPYGNFTFSSSSLKPFNRFQPNLAEMLSSWCFTRFVKFVPIENS